MPDIKEWKRLESGILYDIFTKVHIIFIKIYGVWQAEKIKITIEKGAKGRKTFAVSQSGGCRSGSGEVPSGRTERGRFKMKKGISIWSFREPSLKKCFQMAKAAGFDGVEVALDETGEISLESTQEELAAILEVARQEGITLYSVASGLGWRYSLTDNDASVRAKAEQIIKKQIDTAAALYCDTILVVPGVVTDQVPYETAYERAADAIKRLAPYAEARGITIALENVWNKFLLSPMEMRDFIDSMNSPCVKAYFDVGNVILTGYPEQWIRILGNRIAKVHFKDYRFSAGPMGGFVELLSGDVNYPAVMAAFREIGYDGWVTGELAPYPQYPEAFLRIASQVMGTILSEA